MWETTEILPGIRFHIKRRTVAEGSEEYALLEQAPAWRQGLPSDGASATRTPPSWLLLFLYVPTANEELDHGNWRCIRSMASCCLCAPYCISQAALWGHACVQMLHTILWRKQYFLNSQWTLIINGPNMNLWCNSQPVALPLGLLTAWGKEEHLTMNFRKVYVTDSPLSPVPWLKSDCPLLCSCSHIW